MFESDITLEMIEEINSILISQGSPIKCKLCEDGFCQVVLVTDNPLWLDSYIVNPSNEFYHTLNRFFKNKGIELKYNNTGSRFWDVGGIYI